MPWADIRVGGVTSVMRDGSRSDSQEGNAAGHMGTFISARKDNRRQPGEGQAGVGERHPAFQTKFCAYTHVPLKVTHIPEDSLYLRG